MRCFAASKMRIAIDCRYIRERPSGIGAYVEAIVERLPRLAPDLEFNLWAHRFARRPLSAAGNVTEQTVAIEPNSIWSLEWPRRCASLDGIDLFHGAHNTLPRGLSCRSVVTIHDLMAIERPDLAFTRLSQRIKRAYYPRAVWRAICEARMLIVTTSATADGVGALSSSARARTVVVPMAPDVEFQPAVDPAATTARVAALLGSDAPFLLVVGQDAPNKRQAVALQAFAAGAPKTWRLILVQRQAHDGALRRLAARIGIAKRVTWLPSVAHGDLVTLYQSARALLQPSNYEGFGLPLLEAMSCGCPVIASDLPTLREVIGNGGALVPVDEVAGFANAIRRLAESEALASDSRHAAHARSRIYSWDRCARETHDVYRAALT